MIGAFIEWEVPNPQKRRHPAPGWIIEENGCHTWIGTTIGGYGRAAEGGRHVVVHVWRYEREIGPIPDGLQLDHLCRNRACCNPAHLEPVTASENTRRGYGPGGINARKTECKHGHRLVGDNLIIVHRKEKEPSRDCRTCRRLRTKLAMRAQRARSIK